MPIHEFPSDVTLTDIQELFARLEHHEGSFPKDLIAEIVARQEGVIPRLLEILGDIDRNPAPWLEDGGRMIHIYASYLLALFREARAYPLLVRIFSRPGEFPFEVAGDVVTQDLGRILASVSGGEIGGMAALIENEHANEWVRSVAIDGMVSLVATDQRTREEVLVSPVIPQTGAEAGRAVGRIGPWVRGPMAAGGDWGTQTCLRRRFGGHWKHRLAGRSRCSGAWPATRNAMGAPTRPTDH